jgi:hypothetical protein
MAFTKKSKLADKLNTDVVDKPQFSGTQSNQERFVGVGKKTINLRPSNEPGMKYMSTARETGNQILLRPNTKNTSTLKDPLNSYRQSIMPAVENPDKGNRTSNSRKLKLRQ